MLVKHLTSIFYSLFLIAVWTSVCHAQGRFQTDKIIATGDVLRTGYSDTAKINLYQGNGRFGSSYGSLGLHNNPDYKKNTNRYGQTQYMHIDHWTRAKYNADYLLPLLKIYWQNEPSKVVNYVQHQSFYTGLLKTTFGTDQGNISVETWFDQIDRDLLGIQIDVKGKASDVIVDPQKLLQVHYDQKLSQKVKSIQHQEYVEIQLTCNERRSTFFLSTNATVALVDDKIVLKLHPGKNKIQLAFNKQVKTSLDVSRERTVQWWKNKWAHTGTLLLPDKDAQRLWVRSMGIILCTVNDDKKGFPPPMGFTGNLWPFSFPQDLSYIHSLLLRTGNIETAKAWVERCAEDITGMKAYTRRLYHVDGIFYPWVFPYGSFKGYHDPSPPNIYNFEIHNSGYLCRMAYETATFVDDKSWTEKYAKNLIKETAIFYESIAKKEPDGLWHLSIIPSMGQDEMGGPDQKDYLCALFSAKYCFQKAIEFGLDGKETYRKILKDGLAFPVLESGTGIYLTNGASKSSDIGKQKHPVQLNSIAYLPVDPEPGKQALTAYKRRYELTQDANKPHFYGWTLGEFLLSGSRLGDLDGWKKDWNNIIKADYADPEWIQLYETSGDYDASFYTTTHALIAQSIISNLVDDWFNKITISRCNPWKGIIYLNKIFSIVGIYVGGEINGTSANLHLYAWKDCSFDFCGKHLEFKKGQVMQAAIADGRLLSVNIKNIH